MGGRHALHVAFGVQGEAPKDLHHFRPFTQIYLFVHIHMAHHTLETLARKLKARDIDLYTTSQRSKNQMKIVSASNNADGGDALIVNVRSQDVSEEHGRQALRVNVWVKRPDEVFPTKNEHRSCQVE